AADFSRPNRRRSGAACFVRALNGPYSSGCTRLRERLHLVTIVATKVDGRCYNLEFGAISFLEASVEDSIKLGVGVGIPRLTRNNLMHDEARHPLLVPSHDRDFTRGDAVMVSALQAFLVCLGVHPSGEDYDVI